MAGDWIKFELATLDKPEVLQMAELLQTSPDDVIGKLLRVWGWFDQQSRDGNAGGVTGTALRRFIDRLVASQGFAACMAKVGWLTDAGIPNFDRHNGESAKNRALTNKRVKRFRNDSVTANALPEKRREEKINTHTPTPSRKRPKTSLPENFGLSERVIEWAQKNGFTRLQDHLDAFRLKAVANDYRYSDWDAAFMQAVKGNWAGIKPSERNQFAGGV